MKKLARISSQGAPGGPEVVGDDERRVQPRTSIRLPLRMRIPSLDYPFDSEALNISRSGVFIALQDLPPIGSEVEIDITLESGALLLNASGVVARHQVRREPRGIGIRFVDISYEAQALIDRMLADEHLFGNYRLEALIGRGGMAEVYSAKALDGDHAGEVVAIKRILPGLARDPEVLVLFQREADITRLLRHPSIVTVLDVGTVGDTVYIAMEYVRGCNLSVVLDECQRRDIQIPIDFALYVVKTVAEALHFAHRACGPDGEPLGIVHRDVTPGNIFISDIGEIKLGDFGVMHLASAGATDGVVGKKPYMAPEIIATGRALPASDLFSLGAVLFALLTNHGAFMGEDTKRIWKKIKTGAVPAPSTLRSQVPKEVDALVARMLSPKVAGSSLSRGLRVKELFGDRHPERFANAADLIAALEPLYDPAIGTQLAIASVVRSLLKSQR